MIKPKFSKPDAIIWEYADLEVRARLVVEILGNNLSVVMLDKCGIIPPSMEEEVLETLHQVH